MKIASSQWAWLVYTRGSGLVEAGRGAIGAPAFSVTLSSCGLSCWSAWRRLRCSWSRQRWCTSYSYGGRLGNGPSRLPESGAWTETALDRDLDRQLLQDLRHEGFGVAEQH